MTALSKLPEMHPEEVEALLPWHAAGTLSARLWAVWQRVAPWVK